MVLKHILCAGAIFTGILTGCASKQDIQQFYFLPQTEEQTTAQKRQKLLENILEKHSIPHVADIIYYQESLKQRYSDTMKKTYGFEPDQTNKAWQGIGTRTPEYSAVTIIPRELIGQNKDSVIIVFDSLFEQSSGLEDLLSCLLDHEAVHAKDNAKGIELNNQRITPEIIKKIRPGVYQDILELRAYANQIKQVQTRKRKVSQRCYEETAKAYSRVYNRLMFDGIFKGNSYAFYSFVKAPYAVLKDMNTNQTTLFHKNTLKTLKHHK